MILVMGASGCLGSMVAELLLAQGKPRRAMTRSPLTLAHLKQQGAEGAVYMTHCGVVCSQTFCVLDGRFSGEER